MRIALIGATGFVGSAILNEALNRGHQVTAIARDTTKITIVNNNLTAISCDVFNTDAVSEILAGHDAVVSAYNAGWKNPNMYNDYLNGAIAIQSAVAKSGVKRFIVIGGAGSLYTAPGVQLIDRPEFPAFIKPGATAARDYLIELKKEETLDWSFFSPAIEMHQGTAGIRKGVYRTGLESPVFDENNKSVLSVEDVAVVIVDELQHPKHIRLRFTAAY
jgi:putative NADH-flavin reductase